MNALDQSDIDALVTSAEKQGGESPAPVPAGEIVQVPDGLLGRPQDPPDRFSLLAESESLKRLLPIQVPVRVRLAETKMSIGQLLDLSVGTIIEFERTADSDLDLVANNIPIGYGNAVKCGERFGLRVIRIIPWARRLLAEGLIR